MALRFTRLRRFYAFLPAALNLIAAAAVLYLPMVPGAETALINRAATVLIYAILASGMRVVVSCAGFLDLGYAAHFGIGAYATALLSRDAGLNLWVSVPVSAVLAGGIAALLGGPMVRSGRTRFALVTLAFGTLAQELFAPREPIEFTLPENARAEAVYYAIAAVWIAAALILWCVRRSVLGRAWIAVRDDAAAASCIGLDPVATARSAYVTGAAIAGLAGALIAVQQGGVHPGDFTFAVTTTVLAIVLIGGGGGQAGILAAAIVLVGVRLRWPAVAANGQLLALAIIAAILFLRPRCLGRGCSGALSRWIGAHP